MSRFWDGESDDPLDWGRYEAAKRSTLRGAGNVRGMKPPEEVQ